MKECAILDVVLCVDMASDVSYGKMFAFRSKGLILSYTVASFFRVLVALIWAWSALDLKFGSNVKLSRFAVTFSGNIGLNSH